MNREALFLPFDTNHIELKPQCGICGRVLQPGEKFVALVGNKTSTAFARRTQTHAFLQFDRVFRVKNDEFCRMKACKAATHIEATAVHVNCLNVFLEHCKLPEDEAMRRLWIVATWRSPWKNAPFLYLFDSPNADPVYDEDVLRRLGLASLNSLPPEILLAIQKHSADSVLWCLNAAILLAQELSGFAKDEKTTVPVENLLSWERGSKSILSSDEQKMSKTAEATETTQAAGTAETIDDARSSEATEAEKTSGTDGSSADDTALPKRSVADRPSVVVLTYDARGVSKIERLSSRPPFNSKNRSDQLAFSICAEEQLKDVSVVFQLGSARLQLPPAHPGLQIWDTPTPPRLDDGIFTAQRSFNLEGQAQFLTVGLENVHGLTFLFAQGDLHAVHAHTEGANCAQSTADRFNSRCAEPLTWQYLPLAGGKDFIEDFGVRKEQVGTDLELDNLALLIRTHLAGDILLGDSLFDSAEDIVLAKAKSPPKMLVFGISGLRPITAIGAFADSKLGIAGQKRFDDPFPYSPWSDNHNIRFDGGYVLKAPLAKVNRVEVFYDKETQYSRGAVFTYDNGGQRCIGECRLGVVPTKVFKKPTKICYSPTDEDEGQEDECEHVRIEACEEEETHKHADDEESIWKCFDLEGVFVGYFDWDHFYIEHTDDLFEYPGPGDLDDE